MGALTNVKGVATDVGLLPASSVDMTKQTANQAIGSSALPWSVSFTTNGFFQNAQIAGNLSCATGNFSSGFTIGNSGGNGYMNFSPGGGNPGYIGWYTPDGTRRGYAGFANGNNLVLIGDGGWGWNITASGIGVSGAAGTARAIIGATSGTSRWQLNLGTADAETGSNAGSNLALGAFSDTGGFLGFIFQVTRATMATVWSGAITFASTVVISAFAGTGTRLVVANGGGQLATAAPSSLVSTDAGNGLKAGSDGNLYAAAASRLSGNLFRNGNLQVNQRQVVSPVTLAAYTYGHDGLMASGDGCTYSFSSSGIDTTASISAGQAVFSVAPEDNPGGSLTISWTGTAQLRLNQGSTVHQDGTTSSAANYVVPTVANGRNSYTFAATAAQQINAHFGIPSGTSGPLTLGLVQCEVTVPGLTPTSFQRIPLTEQIRRCERFYQQLATTTGSAGTKLGVGVIMTSTTLVFIHQLRTRMSGIPSLTYVGSFKALANGVTMNFTAANMTTDMASTGTFSVLCTVPNALAGGAYLIATATDASGMIASSELT